MQNTGGGSITWSASKGEAWVSLSSTNGTLTAGASTAVTVSIKTNANGLTPGSYNDTVTFTNTTNGNGNTSRSISLTVTTTPHPTPTISSISPTSGPIGSPVTIIGLNFGTTKATSTVKFGSKVAKVTFWSDTQIQAVIPSLTPGTYDVTVTTKQGTSNAIPFTVTTPRYPLRPSVALAQFQGQQGLW